MGEKIGVRLTSPQIKIIESIASLPEEIEKSVRRAAKEARGTRIQIPHEDLEQLAGWVAAEANYEESVNRKRSLDRLYDEVQAALWDFEDRQVEEVGIAVPKEAIRPQKRPTPSRAKRR